MLFGTDNQKTKANAVCPMASCICLYKLVFVGHTHMKKWKVRKKASFTVEASLIASAVLMAVFLCMYYGFFLHDKAILEAVSWQTAQKAMLWITENSDMEQGYFDWEELQKKGLLRRFLQNTADTEIICQYAAVRIEGELFACDMPVIQVSAAADKVWVSYTAHIRLPFFSLMQLWGVPSKISGSVQVCESEQEEFIRLVRGILGDKKQEEER